MLNLFLKKDGGAAAANFPLICKTGFPIVDESVQLNVFLLEIDGVDRAMIGAKRKEKTGNIPTLFEYYVTTVTSALKPKSVLFSRPDKPIM